MKKRGVEEEGGGTFDNINVRVSTSAKRWCKIVRTLAVYQRVQELERAHVPRPAPSLRRVVI